MSPGSGIVERVAELRRRVAGLVAAERAGDPDADDPFRGLYVTDQHVDRVLETPPPTYPTSAEDQATGGRFADLDGLDGLGGPGERRGFGDLGDVPDGDRLAQLARRARLTALDLDVLVAGLAPDVDPGFEKLYVYLNDDITRRRATTGLALRLAGASPAESGARGRLLGGAPLVDLALLEIDDADRPFLTRTLRVPDRVLQHLLGDARPPADIAALAVPVAAWPDPALVELLARGLADGYGFLHLHDPGDLGGVDLAHTVLSHLGLDMVGVDLARAPADGLDPVPIVREVVLRAAGLVVANADRAQPELLRGLVEGAPVVVTVGREPWDQGQSTRGPVQWRVEAPPVQTRRTLWRAALTDGWSGSAESAESAAPAAQPADAADGITVLDPTVLDTLRLSPGAIRRSVTAARRLAAHYGQPLAIDHLREAARLQASSRLERLARRIRPGASWDDLIVHHDTGADLELLVTRVRHREKVLDEWGLRRRSGHAEGIAALFAGDAGTGKTLAAEVLAGDLGLDLYVVDLSTVVDKYVGETEKNLERIFSEAEGVNGVLFFDEADALFGKRSEVSDARDRYANTEIAYLLQRIEHFDGVAVLATNLRANIDEAFLRRLAAVVDFPEPDAALRRRLWALHLQSVPNDGHVDLDFLAEAFALCGGNVRNVAVTAAYLAAAEDRPVAMTDLVRGVALEYRKLGRLRDESEFGPWIEEVA